LKQADNYRQGEADPWVPDAKEGIETSWFSVGQNVYGVDLCCSLVNPLACYYGNKLELLSWGMRPIATKGQISLGLYLTKTWEIGL
jgi:hypothetical protein